MSSLVQIAANARIAKLVKCDDSVLDIVADLLSFAVEGAEFMTSFQTGHWNGRSSFLARITRTFPAGFVHLVHNSLIKKGFKVQIVKRPLPAPLGPENPIVDEFGNDDPRYEYQPRVMRQLLKHGRGIAQIATGGGKSKIALLCTSRLRRMTLFLTTRGVLMHQMKRAYESTGFKVGVIGEGEWSPKKGVNVGMVQTLVAALKVPTLDDEILSLTESLARKGEALDKAKIRAQAEKVVKRKEARALRTIKFLQMVEFVIGEEAHEAGGNSYFEILQHCINAQYRLALTATPFMRDAAEDNMKLMAAFGPVLVKVSEQTLIERGILAKPYFIYLNPTPHPKLRRTSPWQRARKLEIVEGEGRNQAGIDMARKGVEHGLPVIMLVQMKEHGTRLLGMLKDQGVKARYIRGESSDVERQAALDALRDGEIEVLIGTTIIDVGVDVPAVGMVILMGGGKAEIALRQRVGRGARAKKTGPNIFFVVDFEDKANATLREHAKQRRAIIESTPGFAEGIVTKLPWELFRTRIAA